MKLLVIILTIMPLLTFSQKPIDYFNKAANQYIDTSVEKAIETINEGFEKFPNDPDLIELKRRLEEEQEQENQENKEGEGEEQENEEQKEGESEEKSEEEKEQEQKESEQKEGEEEEQKEKSKEQMTKEKLEEMNISEEKARMLLEAMRQNEIKYLQQQKRKATERPPSGKPDW